MARPWAVERKRPSAFPELLGERESDLFEAREADGGERAPSAAKSRRKSGRPRCRAAATHDATPRGELEGIAADANDVVARLDGRHRVAEARVEPLR